MKTDINEIEVNGVTYIKKGIESKPAEQLDGLPYVIVRTYSAGVFAGYLKSREGKESVLINARRLWYWSGAASLSQLAMEGVKNPDECKFPCTVDTMTLTETIEILNCTLNAQTCIEKVPVWEN